MVDCERDIGQVGSWVEVRWPSVPYCRDPGGVEAFRDDSEVAVAVVDAAAEVLHGIETGEQCRAWNRLADGRVELAYSLGQQTPSRR